MDGSFWKREGRPFTGADLARLKEFLSREGLDYDEGVEFTMVLEEDGQIIASGSCQGNVFKCVAVAKEYQGMGFLAQIMTELINHMVSLGISHYFLFTKPENRQMFRDMSFFEIAATDTILLMENRRQGITRYVKQLVAETEAAIGAGVTRDVADGEIQTGPAGKACGAESIGAIVANCNPFTKGHQYLMETAAKEADWLHVFILSQSNQSFSEEARFQMVKEGTAHIPNVILHKGSHYVVSPATFPTYFIKEKGLALQENCILDLTVFVRHIVPALGIGKRFVGTEPYCRVTGQYNECMRWFLPEHGLEFVEIERLELAGGAVSASRVRELMAQGDLTDVHRLLPESSQPYVVSENELVAVEDMLAARDRRAALQQELLERCRCPLVCFTLNIPGPVKVTAQVCRLFLEGKKRILGKLAEAGLFAQAEVQVQDKTGWEYLCAVSEDASALKCCMVQLEEEEAAARLFDIDVIGVDGRKIGREELGLPGRTCLLCSEPAHCCGRNRTHSLEELTQHVHRLVETFLEEEATC